MCLTKSFYQGDDVIAQIDQGIRARASFFLHRHTSALYVAKVELQHISGVDFQQSFFPLIFMSLLPCLYCCNITNYK